MSRDRRISELAAPFAAARRLLDVGPADGAVAIKRAYRRGVVEHPPDRDPEGFREIRDAYELLTNPLPRAQERLRHPSPFVAAPAIEPVPAVQPGELALAVLRRLAASVDAEALLPRGRS